MGFRYHLNGIWIESDIPLTGALPHAMGVEAPSDRVIRFRVNRHYPQTEPAAWTFVRTWEGAPPWLSLAKDHSGYLLRVHEYADFRIEAHGTEIACTPCAEVSDSAIEQLFVDQILPQVLHLRGQASLHASSVSIGDRNVIAFVGLSGAGKSTLAASLADEHPMVSDDCLSVCPVEDGVVVRASYPSARLHPDSADHLYPKHDPFPLVSPRTTKVRVSFSSPHASAELRLARLYLLETSAGNPKLERLSKSHAIGALLPHLHRLDPSDRDRLKQELMALEHLVTHVPIARLAFEHCYETLPLVHAAIRADLESL